MIGQLIEELIVANVKLYMACEKKFAIAADPGKFSKKEIVENARQDVELCRRRAQLKNKIDAALRQAIMSGEVESIEEVKRYGSDS